MGKRLEKVLLLVIAAWTGATMLGGQVAWMRLAQVQVGSSLLAAGVALAGAMVGLSLGAWIGGRLTGGGARQLSAERPARWKPSPPVLQQAWAALALLASARLIEHVGQFAGWLFMPSSDYNFVAAQWSLAVAAGLTMAVLNVPFGMLLPVVVQPDGEPDDERVSHRGGLFYAVQSLGAVAGAIGLGVLLPAMVGFDNMLLLAGGGHLLIVAVLLIWRRTVRAEPHQVAANAPKTPASNHRAGGRGVAWLAMWLGVLGLAAQVIWFRGLAFHIGSNVHTFAMTTAAFVGCLAVGGLIGSMLNAGPGSGRAAALADRLIGRRPGQFLAGVLLVLAALVALAGFWIGQLQFDVSPDISPLGRLVRQSLAVLLVVGPPAGLMGLAFVVLLSLAESVGGSAGAGRIVGRIVGFNALGSAVGVAAAYGILLAVSDDRRAILAIAVGYLVAALLAEVLDPATGWARSHTRAARPAAAGPKSRQQRIRQATEKRIPWANIALFTLAAAVCVWQAYSGPMFRQSYLSTGAERLDESAEFDTASVHVYGSPDAIVATRRWTATGSLELLINREVQGDDSPLAIRVQRASGVLPLLLAPSLNWSGGRGVENAYSASAMVIGLGTGTTVAPLVAAGAERIVVAELAGGVIDAALNEFYLANNELRGSVVRQFNLPGGPAASRPDDPSATMPDTGAGQTRPQVLIVHADGRTALRLSQGMIRLILVDIVYPNAPGAGGLFSRQFYQLAYDRLADDGVFVHWLPLWQMDPAEASSVVRAFLDGFAKARTRCGFVLLPQPNRPMVALIGSRRAINLSDEMLSSRISRLDSLLGGRPGHPNRPTLADLGLDSPDRILAGLLGESMLEAWAGDAPATTDQFPRTELRGWLANPRDMGANNIRKLLEIGFGQEIMLEALPTMHGHRKDRLAAMLSSQRLLATAFAMRVTSAGDEQTYYRLIKEAAHKDASNAFAALAVGLLEFQEDLERIRIGVAGGDGRAGVPPLTVERAIEELAELDKRFPFDPETLFRKSQLQAGIGLLDDAVATMDELLLRSPGSADGHYRKALLLAELAGQAAGADPQKSREYATLAKESLAGALGCRSERPPAYKQLQYRLREMLK